MKIFIPLIFILSGYGSFAQVEEFELVKDVYHDWFTFSFNRNNNCEFFLFKDSIDNAVIDHAINVVNKRKAFYGIINAGEKRPKDSIVFDSSEKRYIIAQLENLNNNKWPEKIFKKSKKVFPYEVDSMYNSIQNMNIDPNIKLCLNVYTFSHPIFLRNNSLCIFYNEERSFAAREGECWLYKLKRKEWKKYSLLFLLKK